MTEEEHMVSIPEKEYEALISLYEACVGLHCDFTASFPKFTRALAIATREVEK